MQAWLFLERCNEYTYYLQPHWPRLHAIFLAPYIFFFPHFRRPFLIVTAWKYHHHHFFFFEDSIHHPFEWERQLAKTRSSACRDLTSTTRPHECTQRKVCWRTVDMWTCGVYSLLLGRLAASSIWECFEFEVTQLQLALCNLHYATQLEPLNQDKDEM